MISIKNMCDLLVNENISMMCINCSKMFELLQSILNIVALKICSASDLLDNIQNKY